MIRVYFSFMFSDELTTKRSRICWFCLFFFCRPHCFKTCLIMLSLIKRWTKSHNCIILYCMVLYCIVPNWWSICIYTVYNRVSNCHAFGIRHMLLWPVSSQHEGGKNAKNTLIVTPSQPWKLRTLYTLNQFLSESWCNLTWCREVWQDFWVFN